MRSGHEWIDGAIGSQKLKESIHAVPGDDRISEIQVEVATPTSVVIPLSQVELELSPTEAG